MRIAVNGLGRVGKLVLRRLVDEGLGAQVALVNDAVDDPEQHALLMEFDSVHGRWQGPISAAPGRLSLRGHDMRLTAIKDPAMLPLAELDVGVVIDCTGKFKTESSVQPYFDKGAQRVLVSAPVKDGALNLVYGVNHDAYDPARHRLITAASCTTNCLAPIVQVIHGAIGIRHGSITTVHDVTNTQTIVDRPAKDMRRARSALLNLIPTTTGSAKAITQIFPELTGRLNGHAVRVPLLNASLTDCVFEVARETTVDEVNALLRAAATEGPLVGILGFEDRPLVSTDFLNDPRSSIVDGPSTMVVAGTQVKIFAWYDNEWGYACRMVDIARMLLQ